MVRDAIQEDIAAAFPFARLRWPEKIVPGPPFTEQERNRILSFSGASIGKLKSNAEVLLPLIEPNPDPKDYLFKNIRGEPINAANFYDLFRDAQRALSIAPIRDLYSTKDTYMSTGLTNGVSLTWLSEQTGVAVATIMKQYGRFLHSTQADDFEMSKSEGRWRQGSAQIGHQSTAHDRGLMWKDFSGVRRGEELVLWGAIDAANYRYIQRYVFRDDGTIEWWLGATPG